MIKEKINEILKTLTVLTKTGNLTWVEEKHSSNSNKRKYERNMSAEGEDGTKYEIDIKFSLINETWSVESTPSMFIKSPQLPNNQIFAYGGNYTLVKDLRDEVKSMYCTDMNPTIEDVEEALDSILKGINISNYRDTKIEKIFDKENDGDK